MDLLPVPSLECVRGIGLSALWDKAEAGNTAFGVTGGLMRGRHCLDVAVRSEHDRLWRYISLFSGGGSLDLAVKLAFPNAVCSLYIEREIPAVEILVRRIKEGSLDDAPIYSDVGSIEYAPFRGRLNGVIAGWPCPPVSVAGRRKGVEDSRWLWPEVSRAIRETGADWFLGENVFGLLSANDGAALGEVLRDVAISGFDAEWTSLPASAVGASHKRERFFLLARRMADSRRSGVPGQPPMHPGGVGRETGATESAHADAERQRLWDAPGNGSVLIPGGCDDLPLFAPGPRDERWGVILQRYSWLAPALTTLAVLCDRCAVGGKGDTGGGVEGESGAVIPDFCDLAHGLAAILGNRVDQLRLVGNGVVPLCAAVAFTVLYYRLTEQEKYDAH